MSRRAVLVCSTIPSSYWGGGALTALGLVESLRRDGYEVHIICWESFLKEKFSLGRQDLVDKDVRVHALPPLEPRIRKRNIAFRLQGLRPEDVFLHSQDSRDVAKIIDEIQPEVVLAYHWEGLSTIYTLQGYRTIGLVGDPLNAAGRYRRQFAHMTGQSDIVRNWARTLLRTEHYQKEFMVRMLNACDKKGAFAAHHAQEFADMGVRNCRYVRTPLIDQANGRGPVEGGMQSYKILLLGHLHGIATLSGIDFFIKKIFPALCRRMPEDFEVHLIGDGFEKLPGPVQAKLTDPRIKVRGQVSPIEEEMLSARLLLVPTPIPLGIRVRILTAFSFGLPVVTHAANRRGIPELEHEKNCLAGQSGEEMAAQVVRLIQDDRLARTIGRGARETYDKFFSIGSAGGAAVEMVKQK